MNQTPPPATTTPRRWSWPDRETIHVWLKRAALAGLGASIAFVIASAVIYTHYGDKFVPPDRMAVNTPAGGAKIYDRNGTVLYQYVDDRDGLRAPVPLEQISPWLVAATIATEDSSFYTNQGVNTTGIVRAMWQNFNPLSGHFLDGSGGSSITQQLIKNVYFPPSKQYSRSYDRKLTEIVFSLKLTDSYSKDQILTWYLNQISYGGLYNGVEAASRGYFDKPAKDLSLAEAALLAGLPASPTAYSPFEHPDAALNRRNDVLDLMASRIRLRVGADAYFTPDRSVIEAAKASPLGVVSRPFTIEAPHFVLSYVQPELEARYGRDALYHGGLSVTTSLDLGLQQKVHELLDQSIAQFEAQSNSHNGAVTVIDPRTGEILVMLGSRDYFRDDIQGQVNNTLAAMSPGSTFKPFVYLAAFLKSNFGPGTPIADEPVSFRESDGSVFRPTNPSGKYYGRITLRQALGNSLNIPAFKLAQSVGVGDIVAFGRRSGITTLNGNYGPSIAIGGVDMTPLDLAFAYSTLANSGTMRGQQPVTPHKSGERNVDPVAVLQVTGRDGQVLHEAKSAKRETQVAPPQQTFLINSILSDPNAQCLTFGCGGLNVPGHQAAVKTGTSEPFDPRGPDAGKIGGTWAFGYTPDVVVGVWAGNTDRAPITNIVSTSIAFRTMRDTMLAYFNGRPSTRFDVPQGVQRGRICYTVPGERGCAMAVEDYYIPGTVQVDGDNRGQAQPQQATVTPQKPSQQPKPQPTPKPSRNNGNGNNGRNRD
jgi:membrane peptidoglycan carboxypeptidase